MPFLLSSCSSATLTEIQSLLSDFTGINFEITHPDKLDNIHQPYVLKHCEPIDKLSQCRLQALTANNIIKIKKYLSGFSSVSITVIYECDHEGLKKYINELDSKNIRTEAHEDRAFLQAGPSHSTDITHKLYFSLVTKNYHDFVSTLTNADEIDEELDRISNKINNLKSELTRNKLLKQFSLYTKHCIEIINEKKYLNSLNHFANKLLETHAFEKSNKKISGFLKALETAVEEFRTKEDDIQTKAEKLYQAAKSISTHLKLDHNNQLFSCVAKPGNRSKMAAYIDKVLEENFPKPLLPKPVRLALQPASA